MGLKYPPRRYVGFSFVFTRIHGKVYIMRLLNLRETTDYQQCQFVKFSLCYYVTLSTEIFVLSVIPDNQLDCDALTVTTTTTKKF